MFTETLNDIDRFTQLFVYTTVWVQLGETAWRDLTISNISTVLLNGENNEPCFLLLVSIKLKYELIQFNMYIHVSMC